MEMKYRLLFSLVFLSVCFLKTSANPSQLKGSRKLPRNDDNDDDSCEKGQIKHKHAIRDESELNNSNESDSCDEEQNAEPLGNSEISELIRDIMSKIKHTDKKKKEEMNFKAQYDSSSSNNEDCFQDGQIDDYVPKPMKRRQQPKRSFNSDDDSDFSGAPRKNMNRRKGKMAANNSNDDSDSSEEPRKTMNRGKGKMAANNSNDDSDSSEEPRKNMNQRKGKVAAINSNDDSDSSEEPCQTMNGRKGKVAANNSNDDSDFSVEPRQTMNQRKGKVAAKTKQQPKKQQVADDDCDTDDYETALEMKILKRLEEAQSNDDSDCDENIVKPKKSNKNNVGNKQQLKPKATMKPSAQKPSAQKPSAQKPSAQKPNGQEINNKNFNGRQNPSENNNLPCDLNDDDSSDENNFRAKKSDAAVQNELKDLMKKQQTPNKVKTNQFGNHNQLKSTTEKNTKQVIPINLGKKVQLKKPSADKDCNSKELVQEMNKAVTIPMGDKNEYQTHSKKFVEQNNIEKEICTNGGDDSKQPDNIVLLQIYNQIETTDNKESVVVNGSDEENNDRGGKNRKNSKSGKKSGRNNQANNDEDCETEYELKNERLERRLETERKFEEKERYLRLREENARNEERQRMERIEEVREKNEERARVLENERIAVRERNEELFIRRTIKERQQILEREREIIAFRNRNVRRSSPNVRASHTNRNAYQNYNAPVPVQVPARVNQRNNNNKQINRHQHNEACLSNEREAYEERHRREEEYYEERKEREEEAEEKAEAGKGGCDADRKDKSKFMTEDENGEKHFKFSMEMDF